MPDTNQLYQQLIDSLQLLSADYSIQVNSLPAFVVVPDEIALVFHECVLLLGQISAAGVLKSEHVQQLIDIDAKFDMMNNEEGFWTLEALEQDQEWNDVRKIALEILSSLGVSQAKPNLDWLIYVGGNKHDQ